MWWIFSPSTSGPLVGTYSAASNPEGTPWGLRLRDWAQAGAPRMARGRRARTPPGRPSRPAH
eukprot:14166492-Alexandrium_andersonii.AAC.1